MYATREDAIYHAIAPVLDVPGDCDVNDFDAEAIFEEAFSWDADRAGYVQVATGKDFWKIVDRHAL